MTRAPLRPRRIVTVLAATALFSVTGATASQALVDPGTPLVGGLLGGVGTGGVPVVGGLLGGTTGGALPVVGSVPIVGGAVDGLVGGVAADEGLPVVGGLVGGATGGGTSERPVLGGVPSGLPLVGGLTETLPVIGGRTTDRPVVGGGSETAARPGEVAKADKTAKAAKAAKSTKPTKATADKRRGKSAEADDHGNATAEEHRAVPRAAQAYDGADTPTPFSGEIIDASTAAEDLGIMPLALLAGLGALGALGLGGRVLVARRENEA